MSDIKPFLFQTQQKRENNFMFFTDKQYSHIMASEAVQYISNGKLEKLKLSLAHKALYIHAYNEFNRLSQYNPTPFMQNKKLEIATNTSRSVCNQVIRHFKKAGIFAASEVNYQGGKQQSPTRYKDIINIADSNKYKLVLDRYNEYMFKNKKDNSKLDYSPQQWSNYHKNKQLELLRGEFLPAVYDKFEKVHYLSQDKRRGFV
jgi:hypothetical protein